MTDYRWMETEEGFWLSLVMRQILISFSVREPSKRSIRWIGKGKEQGVCSTGSMLSWTRIGF